MITFDQFIKKHLGNKLDWDGFYGGQCTDLYRFYVKEVLGFPQSPGVGGATEIWYSADPQYYDFIKNTPLIIPEYGDIMIWNRKIDGDFGHVAIFIEGDIMKFISLDQNYPRLNKVTKTKHNYLNIIGWLRPKKEFMSDTMQIEKNVFEKLVTKSSKYDEFVKMGYNEPSKIKEDIEECARRLVELRTSEQNATRLSKSLMLEAVKIVEALGLVENSENKAVLAAIKSLMEEPIVEEPQNGSQSDRLPKTYNGYKITGITLKP